VVINPGILALSWNFEEKLKCLGIAATCKR